eukprot:jgi/Chlat1/941/Chrsp108S01376
MASPPPRTPTPPPSPPPTSSKPREGPLPGAGNERPYLPPPEEEGAYVPPATYAAAPAGVPPEVSAAARRIEELASPPLVSPWSFATFSGGSPALFPTQCPSGEELDRFAAWFLVLGIAYCVLGGFAMAAPFWFSLAFEQIIAVILLITGGVTLVHAMQICGHPGWFTNFLRAALQLFVGFWLLLWPVSGVVSLTLLLGIWFIVDGAAMVWMSTYMRSLTMWPALTASGLVSAALGLLIISQWPSSAAWAIGMLIGVNFIFAGASLISLACTAFIAKRKANRETAREPLLASRPGF